MRENTSNGLGEVDHGPTRREEGRCGSVTVGGRTLEPYDKRQLREIVRQGYRNPRPLSLEEARLVAVNRRRHAEDARAMEAWYHEQGAGAARSPQARETMYGEGTLDHGWALKRATRR